jgi:hypothetical protein
MYQLDETNVRPERRYKLPEGSGNARRVAARRNETDRPETRLRVVRVPGGLAFVADKPDT